MKHKFNLWYDFLFPIIAKIIGKKYGCCDKLRNCHRCCRKNGYNEWQKVRTDMEAYLEDNRPTLDEICEGYDECTEKCPAYEFCHNKAESEVK